MQKGQREALHSLVKTPLVYTTVALRDWRAVASLGVASVYAPGSYHDSVRLNAVVDIGDYKSVRSPDEPILVRMTRTPCQPGLEPREQFRAGQRELLATDFETFERNIRDQLARILGPGGFDPARDIVAIGDALSLLQGDDLVAVMFCFASQPGPTGSTSLGSHGRTKQGSGLSRQRAGEARDNTSLKSNLC